MVSKFSGISLTATDTAAMKRFYADLLGLPIQNEGFGDYHGAQYGFVAGAPMIYVWNEKMWGKSEAGPAELAFRCDDVDEFRKELLEKGFDAPKTEPTPWGGAKLTLRDPAGNIVVVMN